MTQSKKVLLTAANGQVGWELQRTVPAEVQLFAMDRSRLDVTRAAEVDNAIDTLKPHVVINTAAYTAVDRAELDREQAFLCNRDAVANLARSAQRNGARLIHFSTDYVFDGTKSSPYLPEDDTNPINSYGASKLAGELEIHEIGLCDSVIIRTAWVYSSHGTNFVKTMLRLLGERDEIRVVCDQVGTPTWAHDMAIAVWAIVAKSEVSGTIHWTDAGVASWYDFAEAIREIGLEFGLISNKSVIRPIRTEDYPTKTVRPKFGVLDKTDTWRRLGYYPRHWREALKLMMGEIPKSR